MTDTPKRSLASTRLPLSLFLLPLLSWQAQS